MDALGLATLDSITSALPFAASTSYSSMTDEDIINLRTLRRLLLLLSGIQQNESSNMVRCFSCQCYKYGRDCSFDRVLLNLGLAICASYALNSANAFYEFVEKGGEGERRT